MTTIYMSIDEVEAGLRQASDALLDVARLSRIIAEAGIHRKEFKEAEASLDRLGAYIIRNGDALKNAHAKLMALHEMSGGETA